MVTECNLCSCTIRQQMLKSANVSHKFLPELLPFQRYKNVMFFTSKKQANVTECNFRNYFIRWQMSKSTNFSHTFLRQLLPSQRYKNVKCLTTKKSLSAIYAITPFDVNCQNLQMSPTHILRQLLPFQTYKNFKVLTSKMYANVTECNVRNYTI